MAIDINLLDTSDTFRCKRCGTCCSGDGFVKITPAEGEAIARHLGLALDGFLADYTVEAGGDERWLIDGKGRDKPCVLLEHDAATGLALCRVQPVKPEQCRTFPMKWQAPGAKRWCEGLLEAKERAKQAKKERRS